MLLPTAQRLPAPSRAKSTGGLPNSGFGQRQALHSPIDDREFEEPILQESCSLPEDDSILKASVNLFENHDENLFKIGGDNDIDNTGYASDHLVSTHKKSNVSQKFNQKSQKKTMCISVYLCMCVCISYDCFEKQKL